MSDKSGGIVIINTDMHQKEMTMLRVDNKSMNKADNKIYEKKNTFNKYKQGC